MGWESEEYAYIFAEQDGKTTLVFSRGRAQNRKDLDVPPPDPNPLEVLPKRPPPGVFPPPNPVLPEVPKPKEHGGDVRVNYGPSRCAPHSSRSVLPLVLPLPPAV